MTAIDTELGKNERASLSVHHGGHVLLSTADLAGALVEASFDGRRPSVRRRPLEFAVRYPWLPLVGWIVYWHDPSARLVLARSEPWALRFGGGAASVAGDLRGITLVGIEMRGGFKRVDLDLPAPRGVVRLKLRGGVGKLLLRTPAGLPVRLNVSGGASHVEFDGRTYGSMGGPIVLTAGDQRARDRYEVEVAGGAGNVTIAEQTVA